MTDLHVLGVMQIVVGLLIALVCIPLIQGRVKRNRFYGFCFPQSLESDEYWYEINRFGAKRLLIWSLVLAALGVGILANLLSPDSIVTWVGISIPVILIIPIIQAYIYGRALTDRDNS